MSDAPSPTRLRCVICDFDGTIANTMEMVVRIVNELAVEQGFRKLEDVDLPRVRDMSMGEFIAFLGVPKRRVPKLVLQGRSRMAREVGSVQPIEGMADALRTIRKNVELLGVLTSNSAENVEAFLTSHSLQIFDFVSSVSKLSGKAKHISAVLRTFSLKADEALYVGDETRDVKASRKAGVAVAGVSWGFNSTKALDRFQPNFLYESPEQLVDLVSRATTQGVPWVSAE